MQHVSRQLLAALAGVVAVTSACGGAPPQPEQPKAAARSATAAGTQASTCERRTPGAGAQRVAAVREGSTVALVRSGNGPLLAYVADEDDEALQTIDVDAGVVKATTPLAGAPSQLLVLADGRVAVAIRDKNRLQVLEPAADAATPLASLCQVTVPTEPVALAATPDDARLVVSSAWAKKLTSYDLAKMQRVASYDLPREPRAVVVDDDGQRAFVAHVVGAKMSVIDLASDKSAADARGIDLRVRKLNGSSEDPKLRNGCQGFALAKSVTDDGNAVGEKPLVTGKAPKDKAPAAPRGRIFAPMVTVDPGESTVRSSGYGNSVDLVPAEAPIVSVVDSSAERALTRTIMSTGSRHSKECLLPRAATFDPDRSSLLVACQGTDSIVELDARGLDPARLERRRWSVPSGPTGIALDRTGARAVVWSQFDHELAAIPLASDAKAKTVRVALPRKTGSKITAQIAWGRELFHKTDDNRISGDGRACASCHPDGREDALTWSTPEGPRQTIMLAGRVQSSSAPYSWFGSHEDLKTHVKVTFQRLGGSGLPDHASRYDELDALVAYLEAMPAPRLEKEDLDAEQRALADRGKDLFFGEAQGCATCHVGGAGTDQSTHDIGSAVGADGGKGNFDTPSLRFVSGTAPYFHDGRYKTMEELLAGSDGKMGHTMHLSRRDVQALKTYLETL